MEREKEIVENNERQSVWKKKIENEKKKWLKKVDKEKPDDPKKNHKIMSRALENPKRRKIMKFIGTQNNKKISEICKKFNITEPEAKMHLDFLKQALIVEKTTEESPAYQLTARGKNYLKNVEKVEDND
ncbi:hypothetical protein AKJ56_01220 [candidate division MSBL1 archaeon SCGC-AAA382N08]|uniref:HTH arsR-type domain-containing protein n=1 Tax=candidate division MSBL1 archaeon SCGC-AAA382N08 TaxID=1698285 RepID=A0A133VPV9_9EURY|nr:hypothetical protein AKJ56_01220 [candidate division MSBL1 archaeon SCGC-AAA382N08]